MKKILVILAACAFMVSCQWWHETFSSAEDCTIWYLDQIYEAGLDGDTGKVAEIQADYNDWLMSLDESEAYEAGVAALQWLNSHPEVKNVLDDVFGGSDDYGYDDYEW
jgi:hypothetical protein